MSKKIKKFLANSEGQVAVIVALLIVAFVGMTALVVDMGSLYENRRTLQGVADAAALAGVQELSESPDGAETKAIEYAEKHRVTSDNVEVTITGTLTTNDTIIVTAKNLESPLYFARVMGKDSSPVAASATAIIAEPLDLRYVVPWGVVEQDGWDMGEPVVLMYDKPHPEGGSGWFGALDLPSESGHSGADGYRENIEKGAVIDLSEGQIVWTEQGKMAGPTEQGIDRRVDTWYDFDYLVEYSEETGLYTLLYSEPQFIIVPIVEPLSEKESGKRDFKILRFEPFILMEFHREGQEAEVMGMFIDKALIQNYGDIGAVDSGLRVIRLIE